MSRRFWASDWGVPVSTAIRGGVTGAPLENSGWQFGSATPRYVVDVSTIEGRTVKTIRCTTAGHLYLPTSLMGMTPAQAAYGEWRGKFYKPSGGNTINWVICALLPDAWNAAGQQGYLLQMSSSGNSLLWSVSGGGGGYSFGQVFAIPTNRWFDVVVKRSAANAFTVHLDGALVSSGNDGVYTVSNYLGYQAVLAGDMVSLGDVCGNGGLSKTSLTL